MTEMTFEYWNELAKQVIMISSLLGGFSIALIPNFISSDIKSKFYKYLFATSTLAACFFLITVFSMTNILMKTTKGYPFIIDNKDLILPRIIGVMSFFFGIMSILTLISLSGWTKSKKMGIFTTLIGVVTLILTLLMTSV